MQRAIRSAAVLAASAILASACSSRVERAEVPAEPGAAATPAARDTALAASPGDTTALPTMAVYKSPTCGCCRGWVEHVQAAGFTVEVHDLDDLSDIKSEAAVPEKARSCHTAIVGGYTIEGHVPAPTVLRLLREKPRVAGIAVAGMPVGTPGMEAPGREPDKYDVLSFQTDGSTAIYESH